MKKIHTGLIVMIALSIFVVCFLIGRATALRDSDENKSEKTEIYSGVLPIQQEEEKDESVEASQKSEKVPDTDYENKKNKDDTPDVSVPERMIPPCGNNIQKEYSQIAIYSETMGDWRAHTGIDYAADLGADVVCSCDGEVTRVYKDKLWGYTVEIKHGKVRSVYKNLSEEIYVKAGQAVKAGDAIGTVGRSADIECLEKPHLHFEVWQDGFAINPSSYVY